MTIVIFPVVRPLQRTAGSLGKFSAFRLPRAFLSCQIQKSDRLIWVSRSGFMAIPHNSTRAFGERFFADTRFEKCRNTLCTRKGHAASVRRQGRQRLRNISNFSNRRIGEKYPAKAEEELCGVALYHGASSSPPVDSVGASVGGSVGSGSVGFSVGLSVGLSVGSVGASVGGSVSSTSLATRRLRQS